MNPFHGDDIRPIWSPGLVQWKSLLLVTQVDAIHMVLSVATSGYLGYPVKVFKNILLNKDRVSRGSSG